MTQEETHSGKKVQYNLPPTVESTEKNVSEESYSCFFSAGEKKNAVIICANSVVHTIKLPHTDCSEVRHVINRFRSKS